MTQEDKKLLLKDLCARLPYYCHFKVRWGDEDYNILDVGFGRVTLVKPFMSMTSGSPLVEEVKPYLRPMSSMTEEEAEQIIKFICEDSISIDKIDVKQDHISAKVDYLIGDSETITVWFDNIIQSIEIFDFLNAHHFDYRGLIEKGLALEAPEDMYEN